MSSSLIQNIHSDWLMAMQALRPKNASKQVLVYVEDEYDIPFWRYVLNKYETDNLHFRITTTTQDSLTKGKKAVLQKLEAGSGEYLLVCVDSDYDYLFQDKNRITQLINSNPHIFQTFTYSIENYRCYANSLKSVCVNITKNDDNILDFKTFFEFYSEIIFELFLWSFYLYKIDNSLIFTIKEFCDVTKLHDFDINDLGERSLKQLKQRVDNKLLSLQNSQNKPNLLELNRELNQLGLEKKNVYLFCQGHNIFDNVVIPILKPICRELFHRKEQQIKDVAKNDTELNDRLKQYWNETKIIGNNRVPIENFVEKFLSANTEFTDCRLFSMVTLQVENYLDIYN